VRLSWLDKPYDSDAFDFACVWAAMRLSALALAVSPRLNFCVDCEVQACMLSGNYVLTIVGWTPAIVG
jgi:hypothetical protein